MKTILFSMLLTVLPPWLAGTFTDDGGACKVDAGVALVADEGKLITVTSDPATGGETEVHAIVVAGAGDGKCCGGDEGCCAGDEKCCDKGKRLEIVTETRAADAKAHGWLGVSIGGAPEALVDQLDIEGRGVMILNVVKDGPAEKAGLQAHDIIMSIDGEMVTNDISKAVELVSSRKPGDKVDVVVLRDGEDKTLTVELGSRADMKQFVWLYKGDPLAEVEERVVTRGKILRRGPGDEWVFEDLGDLDELADLSEKIKIFIPKSGSKSTQVFLDGNRRLIKTRVERDGAVIVVSQEDEEGITVTRVGKDGDETTATYANEDELAAADPEAYELYENAGESTMIHLDLEGTADVDVDLDEWRDKVDDWRDDLQERLEEAGEAYERAIEQAQEALDEVMERWQEGGRDGRSEPRSRLFLPPVGPQEEPFREAHLLQLGKPRHSFTVNEDGSIQARIRKGDSELVRVFRNEEDLANRNPRLHEKYQELIEAEE